MDNTPPFDSALYAKIRRGLAQTSPYLEDPDKVALSIYNSVLGGDKAPSPSTDGPAVPEPATSDVSAPIFNTNDATSLHDTDNATASTSKAGNATASTTRTDNAIASTTDTDNATASKPNMGNAIASTTNTVKTKQTTDTDKPSISETPRTNRTDGNTTKITALRSQIALEMNKEFVECSVGQFMANYLPFVPSDAAVEACLQGMLSEAPKPSTSSGDANPDPNQPPTGSRRSTRKKAKVSYEKDPPLISETKSLGPDNKTTKVQLEFTDFSISPRLQMKEEKIAFEPLERIAEAVGDCSGTCDGRVRNDYKYINCPNNAISSLIKGSNNKIDACFVRGDGKLHTHNIAVPIEQKLKIEDRPENNRQVVSANVQIMNDDVRRMFTYGITFEDAEVTFWFHCRSHSAVSRPFNFAQNPRLLIKVFLSFLFATPKELGYDPNVTLVDPKKRQYIYTIPESDGTAKFYRTDKVISAYRSNNISGRMARVWLVDQVDSNGIDLGSQCVLKDVWLEHEARTEKEIQTDIFADIEKFCHPDNPDYKLWPNPPEMSSHEALNNIKIRNAEIVKSGAYKEYFLQIERDCTGEASTKVVPGFKPVMGLFQERIQSPEPDAQSLHSAMRSVASTGTDKARVNPPRLYTQRKQYRVIFKEVCQAVGNLGPLGDVVDVLQQTLIPLSLMYCAGWVHRDISSGNILAHRTGEVLRAKLSDLEYAKRFPLPLDHKANVDPKTGTPFFMPIEIMQRLVLYPESADTSESNIRIRRRGGHKRDQNTPASSPAVDEVVYNFQHDLESLWWLLLWSITARVDHIPSREWARTIYQNTDMPTEARVKFFLRIHKKKPVDPLTAILLPSLMPSVHNAVNDLRENLASHYSARTREDKLRDVDSYAIIHDNFHLVFDTLQHEDDLSWRVVPLLGVKPDLTEDTDQPNAAAPSIEPPVRSLKPGRKRLASGQPYIPDPIKDFADGEEDDDVEVRSRRYPKRSKTNEPSNPGGSSSNRSNSKAPSSSKPRDKSKTGNRSTEKK